MAYARNTFSKYAEKRMSNIKGSFLHFRTTIGLNTLVSVEYCYFLVGLIIQIISQKWLFTRFNIKILRISCNRPLKQACSTKFEVCHFIRDNGFASNWKLHTRKFFAVSKCCWKIECLLDEDIVKYYHISLVVAWQIREKERLQQSL